MAKLLLSQVVRIAADGALQYNFIGEDERIKLFRLARRLVKEEQAAAEVMRKEAKKNA